MEYGDGSFEGAMRRRRRRPRVKFAYKANAVLSLSLPLSSRGTTEFNFATYFTGANLSFSTSGNTGNLSLNSNTGVANTSSVYNGATTYEFYVIATSTLGMVTSPKFNLTTV